MPKKQVDQRARKNPSFGNEHTFLPSGSGAKKLEHKKKRNMKTRNGNENREDEGNISRLDYELSSYGDLLIRAMKPIRGQKQLLKRLYSDVSEVLEKCTVNELRRAVYEPSFITSLEGKKLAAHFISKIGIDKFWMLVKKVVTSEKTSKMQCVSYGEVLLLAWKNAVKDGIHTLQHRLERIFMDIVYYALQHLHYNKKFMAMLESFGKARSKQIDAMIYRTFEPNLWRCLKAANETVRYNACCLFLPFYPFVSDDDIENAENVNMQQGIIIDLLKDDSYGIRSEACRRTLFILSTYFDTFPFDFIKQCLTQIIDILSVDSIVSVRIAVYEGMRDLLRCGSALNACERALKCLFDNKGINDRCDHVRLVAFELLNALVGHRFIKLSEVVKMDRILKVFALEESDMVRKEIAKLLLPFYMKPGLSPDEVIRRIIVMGRESEIAALSFHHIVVAENLMSVEHAVQHEKSLVLAVYKTLRSLEGIDGCETDETVSMCSEATMCETFIEPIQDETNEKFELWRSSHLLLNCLVVMWLPLRLILDDEKYEKENENLRRLLTKLFKFAFLRYRNTSILEAVMHLGKTLDDWKEGRVLVLQELLHNCSLDDEKATVYLEAVTSWDFLALLKFIDDAFETVKRETGDNSPPKKREKKSKLPSDAFNKDLTSLRQLIMENILQKRFRSSNLTFTFESIIRGIRMQYILAVMILTNNKKDGEEELLKNMQDDVKWLKESVMPEFLTDLTDDQFDMMIKVCETYIYLWTQQLKTYNTPFAFRAELCDIQWIDNMKSSRGAIKLLTAMIELFKNLIVSAIVNNELAEISIASLSISIFKYLAFCSKFKFEDFDRKNAAEGWLSICNTLNSCNLLTSNSIAEQAKIIADLVLKEFLETNKELWNGDSISTASSKFSKENSKYVD
ncbi:Condensin II non structural maintenance of chromosomes subunit family protein [Acanthocheilonema viteae]